MFNLSSWLADALGWLGAGLLLLAYGLISVKKLDGGGVRYQSLNVGGSALLAFNSAYHSAVPSVVLNGVWALIGLVTLAKIWRLR